METPATGSDAYSEGGMSNKPVSYKDFVGLWSHLLNPGKIKVCSSVCYCVTECVTLIPRG